jgi:kinesin family protein 2/24
VNNSSSSSSEKGSPGPQGDDIQYLHDSLRHQQQSTPGSEVSGADLSIQAADDVASLHECVTSLFEEEENLLNSHMNAIQENAELLTEEGQLLARVQGEDVVDYDIDAYAARLDEILSRKVTMIEQLRGQLHTFRQHLQQEEQASQRVSRMPLY